MKKVSQRLFVILLVLGGIIFYYSISNYDFFPVIKKALAPVVGGFVIAYLLDPTVQFIMRIGKGKIKRGIAILITVLLLIALLIILGAVLIPSLVKSLNDIVEKITNLVEGGFNLKFLEDLLTRIDNNLADELIAKSLRAAAVAIDTEFVWERTFFPKLGLVQLAIERECYLIDPVAIEDISPLAKLISSPSVIKIFHDAQQDLIILKDATDAEPKNIFDTRLAYGFCSETSVLSLAALLERTLEVKLPKTETRADWLKRPLTEKMKEYAVDDVKYLTELMELIHTEAQKQNTYAWLEEEMKIYDDPAMYVRIDPYEYYTKIRGIDQLKGKKLAVLRELAASREIFAREKDRPRNHIVHNNTLITLAYKCPQTIGQLKKIDKITPKNVQRYGEEIVECVKRGLNTPPENMPQTVGRVQQKKTAKKIHDAIIAKCNSVNIDPAIVCSRKELNLLFAKPDMKAAYSASRLSKGWRKELTGELFAAFV